MLRFNAASYAATRLANTYKNIACTLCITDLSLTTLQQFACAAERCLTDALGQLQLECKRVVVENQSGIWRVFLLPKHALALRE